MKFTKKLMMALLLISSFLLLPKQNVVLAQSSRPTIAFNNKTNAVICSIYMSAPSGSDIEYGDLLLGKLNFLTEQLDPGNTAEGNIDPGLYSILIKDCSGNTLYLQTIRIENDKTIDILLPDAKLTITNDSIDEICTIRISYSDNPYLSDNWLEDATISPGSSVSFSLASGVYSVVLYSCEFKAGGFLPTLDVPVLQKKINLLGAMEVSVPLVESVIKIKNYSERAICGVYISEDDTGYNSLGVGGTPIWSGFSREYKIVGGNYNIWLTDCQENTIYKQRNYSINGVSEIEITGEKADYYRVYNQAWTLYKFENDLNGAQEKFELALTLAKENKDIEAQEEVLLNLGEIANKLGFYNDAVSYYHDLTTLPGYRSSIGNFQKLSKIQITLAQYDDAISGLENYVNLSRAVNSKQDEAAGYLLMGDIYFAKGDYEKAWLLYQKAEAMDELTSETYLRFGILWTAWGYPREALRFLLMASEVTDYSADDNIQADIYKQIGLVYLDLGMDERAADYLIGAISLYNENQNLTETYSTLFYLGKFLYQVGDIDRARKAFDQTLEFFRNSKNQVMVCEILMEMGKLSYDEAEYGNAREYYIEAMQTSEKNGFKKNEALSLLYLGDIEYNLKNYSVALNYYQKSQELFEEIGTDKYFPYLLSANGKAYEAIGEINKAIGAYKQAIDSINHFSQYMLPLDLKISYATQFDNIFNGLGELLIHDGKYEDAYYYLEMNKSRSLRDIATGLEYGYGAIDKEFIMEPILETYQSQRGDIYKLRSSILELSKAGVANQELVDQLKSELSLVLKGQQEWIRQISIRYASRGRDDIFVSLTLGDVQTLMMNDDSLVEYFLFDDHILIYLIEKSGFSTYRISVTPEALRDAIEGSQRPIKEEQDQYLRTLYSYLIAPIENQIKHKKIVIVPQGELFYVPFAALTNGDEYLIDKFQISLMPSTNLLSSVYENKNAQGDVVLLLGDPEIQEPFLPVLVNARDEVAEIAKIYHTTPIVGKDAKELFLSENIEKTRILHIASHTLLYQDYPLLTSILLGVDKETGWETVVLDSSDPFQNRDELDQLYATIPIHENDGYLEAYEIYNLNLSNTELVVLSGCQTTFSAEANGDEVIGLSGAFLGKKVPVVISSLWVANDESTSYLMQNFYKQLQSGKPASDALRIAQIATREKYPNPYNWAGFNLMGNGDLVIDIKNASLPEKISKENKFWQYTMIVCIVSLLAFMGILVIILLSRKKKLFVHKEYL